MRDANRGKAVSRRVIGIGDAAEVARRERVERVLRQADRLIGPDRRIIHVLRLQRERVGIERRVATAVGRAAVVLDLERDAVLVGRERGVGRRSEGDQAVGEVGHGDRLVDRHELALIAEHAAALRQSRDDHVLQQVRLAVRRVAEAQVGHPQLIDGVFDDGHAAIAAGGRNRCVVGHEREGVGIDGRIDAGGRAAVAGQRGGRAAAVLDAEGDRRVATDRELDRVQGRSRDRDRGAGVWFCPPTLKVPLMAGGTVKITACRLLAGPVPPGGVSLGSDRLKSAAENV